VNHSKQEFDVLKGKTALVTGSTSGIGLGIAQCLARQGAAVVLNGVGEVEAEKAEVAKLGSKVGYHGADMSKPAEIEDMMRYASSDFGGVDILVNNAGIQHVANVEDFPPEKWDAIIAINLSSAFHTTRLAIPHMKAKDWGRVINVASAHGLVASAQKSAYVASKHGIVGFTKAVALETATTGITVNAICPGWVLTPLVQKQIEARAAKEGISIEQAQRELLQEKQPSLQFTTPEQLGELALFLCSSAASNVRGVAWNMDGAWVAQ
jgi:3-hydroxybutyrate dehydrogenase